MGDYRIVSFLLVYVQKEQAGQMNHYASNLACIDFLCFDSKIIRQNIVEAGQDVKKPNFGRK